MKHATFTRSKQVKMARGDSLRRNSGTRFVVPFNSGDEAAAQPILGEGAGRGNFDDEQPLPKQLFVGVVPGGTLRAIGEVPGQPERVGAVHRIADVRLKLIT